MRTRRKATSESPEDLLRRYRDTSDPAALGALFDAEAPGLFRIALALAPDAATADEAVQETFFKVIDAATRCDPSRPVRPWLVTILKNCLIDHRRRAARVVDPLKIEPRLAPRDPASEAERAEMIERVRKEIDALPEPYRAVSLLRWRYGLSPGEIAHVRGEPPGTVRSTLSRSVDRLRKALSAVAPLLLVLGVRPRTGLAAVRKAVLAKAVLAKAVLAKAGAASVAAGSLVVGGALVSYTTAATVLVAVFAAGALATLGVGALATEAPAPPRPSPSASVVAWRPTDTTEPLSVVEHWVEPPRSGASLEDRIVELLDRLNGEWHNSFTVGNLLTSFDAETVVRVLHDRWSTIEDRWDRAQILKAFAFRRFPFAAEILDLGMRDPDPRNRLAAAYHLIGIAGRDFRNDLGDYAPWRAETKGLPIGTILDRTNRDLTGRLGRAAIEEVEALAPVLEDHAWKIRYQPAAAARLLDALEPWLLCAGPELLRDLLRVADQVDPPADYLRRVTLDRLHREPELAGVVFDFLGQDENEWAREDLLRRIRDPFDPSLEQVAVALGESENLADVPPLLDALALAPTVETRAAIEAGLARLTGFETDEWQSWWDRNGDDLKPGGKER